jgi:hypothetical protein
MGPTMLTPRSTVESLQASSGGNAVLKHSRPGLVVGEVTIFESQWLAPRQNRVSPWLSSVLLLTILRPLRLIRLLSPVRHEH